MAIHIASPISASIAPRTERTLADVWEEYIRTLLRTQCGF